jgi:acetolactate synthase-1/2/3 large subunit
MPPGIASRVLPVSTESLDLYFEYQYFLMFQECDRIAPCTGFFFRGLNTNGLLQESGSVELTGAEIFVRSLEAEGVEILFGYPGGAVLHIYDALYSQDKIKHILVRHEQAATHAADGYARSCNKPGVVLVTSGPGATNAVTGIATAYMDSIPMVVFTGQVPTHLIGNDAFQEADNIGITRPCVKHNFLVKDVRELAETIKKAFYVATTGRSEGCYR